jgi:hypothetical protein
MNFNNRDSSSHSSDSPSAFLKCDSCGKNAKNPDSYWRAPGLGWTCGLVQAQTGCIDSGQPITVFIRYLQGVNTVTGLVLDEPLVDHLVSIKYFDG